MPNNGNSNLHLVMISVFTAQLLSNSTHAQSPDTLSPEIQFGQTFIASVNHDFEKKFCKLSAITPSPCVIRFIAEVPLNLDRIEKSWDGKPLRKQIVKQVVELDFRKLNQTKFVRKENGSFKVGFYTNEDAFPNYIALHDEPETLLQIPHLTVPKGGLTTESAMKRFRAAEIDYRTKIQTITGLDRFENLRCIRNIDTESGDEVVFPSTVDGLNPKLVPILRALIEKCTK
jgi:hypothetical protein